MTREQAIQEEMRRYLGSCKAHCTRQAHIHRLALDRLKFPYTRKDA